MTLVCTPSNVNRAGCHWVPGGCHSGDSPKSPLEALVGELLLAGKRGAPASQRAAVWCGVPSWSEAQPGRLAWSTCTHLAPSTCTSLACSQTTAKSLAPIPSSCILTLLHPLTTTLDALLGLPPPRLAGLGSGVSRAGLWQGPSSCPFSVSAGAPLEFWPRVRSLLRASRSWQQAAWVMRSMESNAPPSPASSDRDGQNEHARRAREL